MMITDLVAPEAILPALKVNSKKQALQELAARAASLTGQNERAVFEVLLQREKLGTTAVGYGVIMALQLGAGWPAALANAGGYAVGLVLSYGLNRRFTFASKRPVSATLLPFLGAAATAFGLNLLTLFFAERQLMWPPAAAQLLAMASYIVCFYGLSRWVVFRSAGV